MLCQIDNQITMLQLINMQPETRWIEAYDQAQTVEETKEVICDKYCLTCKKRKRNSCKNSDIGEDALLLSVNGFNQ